jgi:hypothetical protein
LTAPTLTLGLQNLRRQIDAEFPTRDHASDGWIGDAAHQAKTSGHNPDDTPGSRPAWDGDTDGKPEVRAWDMDSDPLRAAGVDAQDVVDHVRALPGVSQVLRYMIFNRKIYHSRVGFTPAVFDGAPHTEHIHFEGAWSNAADNNTTFDYQLGDLMAIDYDKIRAIVREEITAQRDDIVRDVWASSVDVDVTAAGVNKQPAGSVLAYTSSEHHRIESKVDEVLAKLDPPAVPST